MENTLISIVEVLLLALSIDYFFCHTHQLRLDYKKTYILFYLCFLFFFIASLPFFEYYFLWIGYQFVALFIISHLCFDEPIKKRLMLLGIFGIIYIVEEMVTMAFSSLFFQSMTPYFIETVPFLIFKLCLSNLQMLFYCFFVDKLLSRQFDLLKQFYVIPLGQAVLLIVLYFLSVIRCEKILGYIFIIFALLVIWSDYVLYQTLLAVKREKISGLKYVQSLVFTDKQNSLKKLRHDLLNHYIVLETLIQNDNPQEVEEYMNKMKKMYETIEDNNDI